MGCIEVDYKLTNKQNFDKYFKELKTKRKYDPRPDLKKDSWLWKRVLKTAEKINKNAYQQLYNARTIGAKLKRTKDRINLIEPNFKDNSHLISSKKDWKEFRKEKFLPYKDDIIKTFDKINEFLEKKSINLKDII